MKGEGRGGRGGRKEGGRGRMEVGMVNEVGKGQ